MSNSMERLKILIVDDEVLIAEDLKDLLSEFGCKQIEMAHSKNEALERIQEFKPFLILLDIRMQSELEGLELADLINEKHKTAFIFITAHSDATMIRKIVKAKPFAYITKPVKKSDLFATVNLFIEMQKENSSAVIHIKDGYDNIVIEQKSILYIQSEGNYINIFTDNKKIVSRQSLESILSLLPENEFARVHRSYIVNIKRVVKFSKKEVQVGPYKVPVSRNNGDGLDSYFS